MVYNGWDSKPDNLLTLNQLADLGLRPPNSKKPDAHVSYKWYGKYKRARLYDKETAVPKRKCSDEELKRLEDNRNKAMAVRTCKRCKQVVKSKNYLTDGYCDECDIDRQQAKASKNALYELWKLSMLPKNWAVVDLETTGLDWDARIVEVCIVDGHGRTVYHQHVNPEKPVGESYHFHGCSDQFLSDKPTLVDVAQGIKQSLSQYQVALAYNASYDRRVLEYDMERIGVQPPTIEWDCVANLVAAYARSWWWSRKYRTYQLSQMSLMNAVGFCELKLDNWHTATADALAVQQIVFSIASTVKEEQEREFNVKLLNSYLERLNGKQKEC